MAKRNYNSGADKAAGKIYGYEHSNGDADRIADAALNGEFLNPSDTIGIVPEKFGLGEYVIDKNSGVTGSAKGGHTHEGDVEGGSGEVRNKPAAHERHSLKDRPPVHERESFTEE
ncbi:MAG TPA: hypothetical protein VEV41_06250 [Terriglobales bacterium]|nr:hypothetical protein [Terriglobales bacterium]